MFNKSALGTSPIASDIVSSGEDPQNLFLLRSKLYLIDAEILIKID
jgi:hypothetical protein